MISTLAGLQKGKQCRRLNQKPSGPNLNASLTKPLCCGKKKSFYLGYELLDI